MDPSSSSSKNIMKRSKKSAKVPVKEEEEEGTELLPSGNSAKQQDQHTLVKCELDADSESTELEDEDIDPLAIHQEDCICDRCLQKQVVVKESPAAIVAIVEPTPANSINLVPSMLVQQPSEELMKTEAEESLDVHQEECICEACLKAKEAKKLDLTRTTCNYCHKTFTRPCNLRAHEKIHTGTKPFPCLLCGKRFITSSALKWHHRTHTGEKPHKCTQCPRTFTLPSSLRSHERWHRGEKPFKCVVCGKKFGQKHQLKSHVRVHTGERPYHCDICKVGFKCSSNLNNHLLTEAHRRKVAVRKAEAEGLFNPQNE